MALVSSVFHDFSKTTVKKKEPLLLDFSLGAMYFHETVNANVIKLPQRM